MTNVQSVPRIKKPDRGVILTAVVLVAIYALVFALEQILPPTSMLFTVLKKGATYALVAVSMNLLNGFTGLFSLGQAGSAFRYFASRATILPSPPWALRRSSAPSSSGINWVR